MKSIYITSVERFVGKTAACLAIGKRLQADGYKVGYLKPVSLQPYRIDDHIAEEDASFVKKTLGLAAQPWDISPVIVTPDDLRERLKTGSAEDMMDRLKAAFESLQGSVDVMILEGGATLREGYSVGLPTPEVARTLGTDVIVLARYYDDVRLLDDILASRTRIGSTLTGVLVNRSSKAGIRSIEGTIKPYLSQIGVRLFGVLPELPGLAALTVGELVDTLDAEIITKYRNLSALVENLTVGAMTQEAALSRFRRQSNKAVITGGDRSDIQLAALETSTACLILTGNLRPSPLVIRQAEDFGVTVLLVQEPTMETIEKIEQIYGKNRLGQEVKLRQFERLMDEHFDYRLLYSELNLDS